MISLGKRRTREEISEELCREADLPSLLSSPCFCSSFFPSSSFRSSLRSLSRRLPVRTYASLNTLWGSELKLTIFPFHLISSSRSSSDRNCSSRPASIVFLQLSMSQVGFISSYSLRSISAGSIQPSFSVQIIPSRRSFPWEILLLISSKRLLRLSPL